VSRCLFQTAIGEQAAVGLPDGSSFDLNTNSRVWVDYSKRARVVYLERGEAFFKVAHDPLRPFWVHAGDRRVRAVGTAFNVYLRPRGAEVTVREGTVNVVNSTMESPPTEQKPAAAVTAGEQADAQGSAPGSGALLRAMSISRGRRNRPANEPILGRCQRSTMSQLEPKFPLQLFRAY
jgi:transmembrane sensor